MYLLNSHKDAQKATEILHDCFLDNANFRFIFGQAIHGWRFKFFIKHFVSFSKRYESAYISEDKCGVAFLFPIRFYHQKKRPINWRNAPVFIPIKRLFRVHRFMAQINEFEPKEPHLNFMILAVKSNANGLSTVIEIRDKAFELSLELNLPIYAQTSSGRTKKLYERYGFCTYASVQIPESDATLYFLKRTAR